AGRLPHGSHGEGGGGGRNGVRAAGVAAPTNAAEKTAGVVRRAVRDGSRRASVRRFRLRGDKWPACLPTPSATRREPWRSIPSADQPRRKGETDRRDEYALKATAGRMHTTDRHATLLAVMGWTTSGSPTATLATSSVKEHIQRNGPPRVEL